MPQEIELKLILDTELSADADLLLDSLEGVQSKLSTRLVNTYFDTPSRAVHRAGRTLRIRRDGDRWIQTLKRSAQQGAGGLSKRSEWEWDIQSQDLDLNRLADLLPKTINLSTLAPLFSTDFERKIWLLDFHGSQIVAFIDLGLITASGASEPISEIELEIKSGDISTLLSLAKYLVAQIPLRVGVLSKAGRAAHLLSQSLKPDQQHAPSVLRSSEIVTPPSESLAEALIKWERLFECLCRDLSCDSLSDAKRSLNELSEVVGNKLSGSESSDLSTLIEQIENHFSEHSDRLESNNFELNETTEQIQQLCNTLINTKAIGRLSIEAAVLINQRLEVK